MKQHLVSFLACISCLSLPVMPGASGAPGAPMPAPDGQRFLFIVDTSSGMERLKAENETAIYDLIGSGLYGQMQTGDTYAMWVFDKGTQAGEFPMQVWDAPRAIQLAAIAAAHLSDKDYENTADVKRMTDLLTTVVHAVSNLNAFIISDGSTSMRGTPFDKTVNAEYKKKRQERNSAKRPFVTTLIARDGSFTNYSVVVAGQPILLPKRPVSAVAIATKAAPPLRPAGVLLSNTPGASVTSATATAPSVTTQQNQPAPAPAPAPANVATITPSSNAVVKAEIAARRVIQIVTKSNSVPAAIERSAPEPGKADVTLASDVAQINNPAPELSAPAPGSPALPAAAASPVAESPSPRAALAAVLFAPVTVAARELQPGPENASPAPPPVVQAAALPVPSGPGAGLFLAFGSLLMAAAFFLLFVVLRRLRPAPGASLITQSMERR